MKCFNLISSVNKLVLFVMVLLVSCSSKNEEPFCVTYEVLSNTVQPYRLTISYKDSSGYVVLDTAINKRWSKKICLSPNDIASLSVTTLQHYRLRGKGMYHHSMFDERSRNVTGKIIHEKRTLSESGKTILISLLPSEL
ncbi:MAG: hypothetical protein LBQ60_01910 [Bacteroidales bacterium]|jgi:hypothetical protein|nr:hypothetical protein [Bacteroidales bacterium]